MVYLRYLSAIALCLISIAATGQNSRVNSVLDM
jgi:hypothetical protein